MRKNISTKSISFVIISLFIISSFQIVSADGGFEDDKTLKPLFDEYDNLSNENTTNITLVPAGSAFEIQSLAASTTSCDIGDTITITWKVKYTWVIPIVYTFSTKITCSNTGDSKSWTGQTIWTQTTISYSWTFTPTNSGTFVFNVESYTDSPSDSKSISVKVNPAPIGYSISSFYVDPATMTIGNTAKVHITVKALSNYPTTQYAYLYVIDTTQSKTIFAYILIFLPLNNRKELTYSFDIPGGNYTITTAGTYTLTARVKSLTKVPVVTYDTKTVSFTANKANTKPNDPQVKTIPTSASINELVTITTKISDPDGDKCSIRYKYGDGTSATSWSSYATSGSINTISSKRYSADGDYTVMAQVKDINGDTTDWCELGTISIAEQVAGPVLSFTASDTSIEKGESTTLSWSTSNANSLTISNVDIDDKSITSDSIQVSPMSTTTYTAIAIGSTTTDKSIKITVTDNPANEVTVSLTASKASISAGESVDLIWSSTNANYVTIDHDVLNEGAKSGRKTISPAVTTTYLATAIGSTTDTDSVTITVSGGVTDLPTISLTLSTTNIAPGGTATISWTSMNANSVSISNGISTNNALSGSAPASPAVTTTYVATATGVGGTNTAAITLSVTGAAAQEGEIRIDLVLYVIIIALVLAGIGYYLWKKKEEKEPGFGGKGNIFSRLIKRDEGKENILSKLFKRGKKKKTFNDYLDEYDTSAKGPYDRGFDDYILSDSSHDYYRKRPVRRKKAVKKKSKTKSNARRRKR